MPHRGKRDVVDGGADAEAVGGVADESNSSMIKFRRGTNLDHIAGFNASVMLSYIRTSPSGTSRAELRQMTGLSPQTVSDVCQRLLDQGLIAETGTTTKGIGRPRRTLQIVPKSRYALGIHIDPSAITCVLLDLAGTLVAHSTHQVQAPDEPDQVLDDMAAALAALLAEADIERSAVLGIGIAAPGPLDIKEGVIVDPPHLPGWRHVALRARLEERTGFDVVLDKDVTAAATAERWTGAAADSRDFVFLYLGTGVGAGVVSDDLVMRGRTGNAGDIGHLMVATDGPLCELGHRGCLGTVCSPLRLIERAVEAGVLPGQPGDDDVIQAVRRLEELSRAAEQGDQAALEILDVAAEQLARAVGILANAHDTELVVCGGPSWAALGHHYLPRLREVSDSFAMRGVHGLSVVGTTLGADVAAIGAACLVLDDQFAPRPSSLLLT